jgi:hypothetical protein
VELGHALETLQDMFLARDDLSAVTSCRWILKVVPGQPDTPYCRKDRILL